jgi:hypothetical protein
LATGVSPSPALTPTSMPSARRGWELSRPVRATNYQVAVSHPNEEAM